MIFVTVGTHEQQFDRLVRKMDELKRDGKVMEEVVIQTGYSTYRPQYCTWSSMIPAKEMSALIKQARIVITHGGPSSFMAVLREDKVPIVVPRQHLLGEHVNEHQYEFCLAVEERQKNIILIRDVEELEAVLPAYEQRVKEMTPYLIHHTQAFTNQVEQLAQELVCGH